MENPGTQVPFQTGKKLILRVAGDLQLLGSADSELVVSSSRPRHVEVKEEGNLVNVFSKEDAWVRVPAGADVRVEHVGGDAVMSGLTGSVEVSSVGGDLRHNGAEKLDVGHVGGDLTVAGVSGALAVRRVGGDFTCDVTGSISVEMIGGDSHLRVKGATRLRTGGDLSMRLDTQPVGEVVLRAGGDIDLFIAPGLDAQLDLTSGGRETAVLIQGRHDVYEQENTVLTLGKGGETIRVKAGGDIKVVDSPEESMGLEDEFAHVEEEFKGGHPSGHHEHRHDHAHDPQYWNDFETRIHERANEAARRAESRVRAAMERVERDNQRRERFMGKDWGKRFGFIRFGEEMPGIPTPPEPTEYSAPAAGVEPQAPAAETTDVPYDYASASAITNEERMLVLKMLQEHKITVEEAEQLLAELEG